MWYQQKGRRADYELSPSEHLFYIATCLLPRSRKTELNALKKRLAVGSSMPVTIGLNAYQALRCRL
jgi:hypothetical protein